MSNVSAGSSSTILLVDDEPDILRSLQLILKPAGYRIDVTSTGASALEAIKNIRMTWLFLMSDFPTRMVYWFEKMTGYRPDLPSSS